LPMINGGRVRALATTGLSRSGVTPNVPTLNESGLKGFDVTAWVGMVAPKGTPADVVDKLNTEINRIFKEPGFRQSIVRIGIDPIGDTPAEFGKYLAAQIPLWRQRAIEAGLKIE
jgi:tripartite-type tricarboxylate transporter receptor subunit TctC